MQPDTPGHLLILLSRGLARLLLPVALTAVAASGALAQLIELEPSAVAACLAPQTNATAQPSYPFAAYKFGKAGRVLVELHFTGPDLRPAVRVLSNEGEDAFVAAVRSHVNALRVPCLPAGKEVRLRQEYVFKPEGGEVGWTPAVDLQDEKRREQLGCMRHVSGKKQLEYPLVARQREIQGRVFARVRFFNDDQAPQVQVLYRQQADALGSAVQEWLQGLRLPCHSGEPVLSTMTFIFRLGDDAFGFKPMTLVQFVSRVQGWRQKGLVLDTHAMACPFDLKLHYLQPQLANSVGERGPIDARRRPLLEWLKAAQLDLNERTADAVFADFVDIHVPCLRIEVPPEGSAK